VKSYQRVLTDPLVSTIMATWPGAVLIDPARVFLAQAA
jgi:hypothetical protein